jgi:hypothetical protein
MKRWINDSLFLECERIGGEGEEAKTLSTYLQTKSGCYGGARD